MPNISVGNDNNTINLFFNLHLKHKTNILTMSEITFKKPATPIKDRLWQRVYCFNHGNSGAKM